MIHHNNVPVMWLHNSFRGLLCKPWLIKLFYTIQLTSVTDSSHVAVQCAVVHGFYVSFLNSRAAILLYICWNAFVNNSNRSQLFFSCTYKQHSHLTIMLRSEQICDHSTRGVGKCTLIWFCREGRVSIRDRNGISWLRTFLCLGNTKSITDV